MPLPAPNLDDRRFQQLVDEAKRYVQRACPEWTDHNVSDPGVTLIEAFAAMVDQVVFRMNQIPDLHYIKFLELLGVRAFSANAAEVNVTFRLSAPLQHDVTVPAGTRVATPRTEAVRAIEFQTVADLEIGHCDLRTVRTTMTSGDDTVDSVHDLDLQRPEGFACFNSEPQPGDALLVGLDSAVPYGLLSVYLECEVEGLGVNPDDAPLVWEAFTPGGWEACEIDVDETRALNTTGRVLLHLPAGHASQTVDGNEVAWIRARILATEPGQDPYYASPIIHAVRVDVLGATTTAVNATATTDEVLGFSEGVPGQRFQVQNQPIVDDFRTLTVEVADHDGAWDPWTEVEDFSASGPDDAHVTIDRVSGEIAFGPEIRLEDGRVLRRGAVPAVDVGIRVGEYRWGGGREGNVGASMVSVLKSSVPYVAGVSNRLAASGGRDSEDIENVKMRGPLMLRSGNRAVTAEDYEQITLASAREIARVKAVPEPEDHGVRVLVVPYAHSPDGNLDFEELVPADSTLASIEQRLAEVRMVGARVIVEVPRYRGVTVVVELRAHPNVDRAALAAEAEEALNRYFHPLVGGPDGQGWPFGRSVHVGEVYSVLQPLNGTEMILNALLFPANPVTGERDEPVERIELGDTTLVFSYGHQVRVV
jgi:predicted phage baseplate assembly protein